MRMTFSHASRFLDPVGDIMAESREAGVNYRNPLGLTHLFAQGHHYGPAPWYAEADRLDWTAAYYHRARSEERRVGKECRCEWARDAQYGRRDEGSDA